jgi:hypothetical protein
MIHKNTTVGTAKTNTKQTDVGTIPQPRIINYIKGKTLKWHIYTK